MTNDKLKSAIDVIGERLNELERLTALLSRFAAAAEAVLRYVPNVTEPASRRPVNRTNPPTTHRSGTATAPPPRARRWKASR